MNGHPVEVLRDKLQGVKRLGRGWMARCPAHDDRTASLHFQRGAERDLVVHCFAEKGCTFKAISDACGLPSEMRRNVVEPEATYVYCDAEGRRLYAVVRLPGKNFLMHSWDASGNVVWGVKGLKRLLYRLPEVLAAAKRRDEIWVVEGERDVETCESFGIVATTVANGSGVKFTPDFVAPFHGAARVRIIADCDDSGRRAAWARRDAIQKVVADVRVIDLDRYRDDHYDVSDWRADGGTLAQLQYLEDEALSERPPELSVWPSGTEPGEKTGPAFFLKMYVDVRKRRDLTQSEKTVLSHIRRDVELSKDPKKFKGFRFDLSSRAMADENGITRTSVKSAINGLEAKGFIIAHRTNGGRQKRNSYEIVTPMPSPQTGQKLVHLLRAETPDAKSVNGPEIGPDMDQKLAPHINRVAEISITLGENTSVISELESQSQPEKIPENLRPERLACGHALPWRDESGNVCCMGCDPPPGLHVIAPTAEAIRAFTGSVTSSTWPARPEDWK